MIDRILVPIDFSDVSNKALNYAISMAIAFKADLLLANVIEDSPAVVPDSHGSTFEKKLSFDETQKRLEAIIPEDIRRTLQSSCLVKRGPVEDGLLAVAKDQQVTLIVMGTHGRRAFARWLLGSVTERILRKVSVPTITVSHPEGDIEPWRISNGRLLYATDLSYGSEHGMTLAYELAKRFDAELTVLHVMLPWSGILSTQNESDHEQLRERMLKRLEESIPEDARLDARVHLELREGGPYQAILDVAEEKVVDLIVVNLHGQDRTEREALGSTAERVIRGSARPVLSIPWVS